MIFTELALKGAYLIEIEPLEDERGFFARSFCAQEFEQHQLCSCFVQNNISYNRKKGTLRGMHYQAPPYEETKLVSCIQGSLYDVIVDLRPGSATYRQCESVELNSIAEKILYIPQGFAHGFQTLEDNTVVFYQISEFYHPEVAKDVNYRDPRFNINWPLPVTMISKKDRDLGFISEY
jgi:dTDP-4-dehydrorhamnose 3,5-epimerase